MNKSSIAFSFDDGRIDNYYLYKNFLEKENIPATFNITTDYIDKTIEIDHLPCENEPMTIENIIEISKNSRFEIALHGAEHNNSMEDVLYGLSKLQSWINIAKTDFGFASPNSKLTKEEVLLNEKEYLKNGIKYVRISFNNKKNKLKTIARKILRIIPNKYLFYYVFHDSMLEKKNGVLLYSVPILHNTTLSEIKYMINKCKIENKSIIFMMHSVIKKNEKHYKNIVSYDYEKFKKICVYSKKININILTVSNLYDSL